MAGQVLGQGITSTHKTSRIQHKRRLMYDEWSAKRRVGLLHRESPVHNPIDWVHRRGSEESRGPLLWSGRQDNTSITYTFRLGHFPKRKKHTPRNTTPKENCTVISHNSPSQRGFAESTSKRKRHHRSTILFYQSISFSRSFFGIFFSNISFSTDGATELVRLRANPLRRVMHRRAAARNVMIREKISSQSGVRLHPPSKEASLARYDALFTFDSRAKHTPQHVWLNFPTPSSAYIAFSLLLSTCHIECTQ